MFAGVWRLVMAALLLFFMGIASAQGVGTQTDNALKAEFYESEGQVYPVYLEDAAHHIRVGLAGQGCHKPLPPWANTTTGPSPSLPATHDTSRFYKRTVTWAEAKRLLRCP